MELSDQEKRWKMGREYGLNGIGYAEVSPAGPPFDVDPAGSVRTDLAELLSGG
jgi:hypothetical protein